MKILVINSGSSSLKYQLFDMAQETVLAKGLVERIGSQGSVLTHQANGKKEKMEFESPNHEAALRKVFDVLTHTGTGVLKDIKEIDAVGHRVVHAGEKFASSVRITPEVVAALEECSELAPLHNPPGITGIRAITKILPDVPQVGVFDTAFHQTMPKEAYIYPIPYEYYEKHKIRRYGFHGTSHRYVSMRAAAMLGKPIADLKLVTCHLGNGSSVAAVDGGRSIDTSMGFTPLAGIPMGTRSGDLDPAIVTFIAEKDGVTAEHVVQKILNKQSGVLGVSGLSNDFRDLEVAAEEGNERAALALTIFANGLRKYIAAYAAVMNGVDAIIFTAGIGENSKEMRSRVCQGLAFLGVEIDEEQNDCRGVERDISTPQSKVRVLIIPTNEELVIARDTREIVFS
ncbi:MAG TPA: acetate kinase [Firmicutes bacterium]|nr:acetate kinase [Bacillota bacterium]HBL68659.1 acetate kinase [Bacillota bacterium]